MTHGDVPVAPSQPNYDTHQYNPGEVEEEAEEDPYGSYDTHNTYYQPNPAESVYVEEAEEELRSPGLRRLTRDVHERP